MYPKWLWMDYNLDLWRYTNKLIIIMTQNLMKNGTIIRTVILLMPYDWQVQY